MTFTKQVAKREQVKLMIGLAGPAGSGKTLSALKLAHGITGDWEKIVVADTENKSAAYYAGKMTGPWSHIDFQPPYHPRRFRELIEYAEQDPNAQVLIIDSISHEWEGKGGCLELVTELSKSSKGNTFTPWGQVTPLHNQFIDAMRNSRLHVIATMRAKTDYVISDDKGKMAPKKVGLKSVQREGVDYEFGVVFDIDISHYATCTKDRTNLFIDAGPLVITEDIGKELLAWANSGEVKAEPIYTGEPEQKNLLARYFSELGIADVDRMKEINAKAIAEKVHVGAKLREFVLNQ